MFGKIFESMYDGTLASNGPWQALVTFQQMIVLADQDGVVDMTASAIARRTSIPLEIIQLGVNRLMEPDPESRTPDEDGRRITLLEDHRAWGWRIVNHGKYRDMRKAEERREYLRIKQQESRERKSTIVNTSSTKINTSTHTEADTKAEAEEQKRAPKRTPPALPAGFVAFWNAWPTHPRKVGRKQCAAKWTTLDCESITDQIVAAVIAAIESKAWRKDGGEFIPMPATWLNQARWEAPTEAQAASEQQEAAWTETRAGIDGKARSLGLLAWADYESAMMKRGDVPQYPTFRREVFAKAGEPCPAA